MIVSSYTYCAYTTEHDATKKEKEKRRDERRPNEGISSVSYFSLTLWTY